MVAHVGARIGVTRVLNRHVERVFNPVRKSHHWEALAEERPVTIFVCVNASKQVGGAERIKVFGNQDAAGNMV